MRMKTSSSFLGVVALVVFLCSGFTIQGTKAGGGLLDPCKETKDCSDEYVCGYSKGQSAQDAKCTGTCHPSICTQLGERGGTGTGGGGDKVKCNVGSLGVGVEKDCPGSDDVCVLVTVTNGILTTESLSCMTKDACTKATTGHTTCEPCDDPKCGDSGDEEKMKCHVGMKCEGAKDCTPVALTEKKCVKEVHVIVATLPAGCGKWVKKDGSIIYDCAVQQACDNINKEKDGKCHFCNKKDLCHGARKSAQGLGFGMMIMTAILFWFSVPILGM